MNDSLGEIFLIVIGIIFAVFHRKFARGTIRFCEEHHLSHGSENTARIGFLLIGLIFAISGLLKLLV